MYSYDYVCVVTSYRLISSYNQYFVKKKYCNFDTYRKMSIILNCIVLSNNTTVGGGWKFDQYILYSNHSSSRDIKKIMGRSKKNKQNQEEEGGKIVKWQLHAIHNGVKKQIKLYFFILYPHFTRYFNYCSHILISK